MTFHAPQIIWLIWMVCALCLMAHEHGNPKTGEHSFPVSFVSALLGTGLLYWGGFFSQP